MFADVGFLSSVGAQVGLEVLQTRIGLGTAFKLHRDTHRGYRERRGVERDT